jgi:ABC-2 type transport system ATP-binding protein
LTTVVPVVEARGLSKSFGDTVALDAINLTVGEGRILGLVGPNGAGKTTFLHAMLGLTPYEGTLRVLGHDPRIGRHRLMRDATFIADVSVLPRWMRVSQALDYMEGVHPRFDRYKAEELLALSSVPLESIVRGMSKGMVAQLHVALIMAIDARLLALDEPTLGLDLHQRKKFYETLLTGYFDNTRTIVLATHQVEEIENVVTDIAFIHHGRLIVACSMDEFAARFVELMPRAGRIAAARALAPIHERQEFGRSILLFERADREQLAALGDARTPSIADVFVAMTGDTKSRRCGAA